MLSELVTFVFKAQVKLIQAGLLAEASELEGFLSYKPSGTEEDGGDAMDVDLTVEGEKERIEAFVKKALKNGSKKKFVKTTLIVDSIRKIEKMFLAAMPTQRCQNCKGISPAFRNDGVVKIFEKPLQPKQLQAMAAMGLVRQNLFGESEKFEVSLDSDQYVSPLRARALLQKLWNNEREVLDLFFAPKRGKKGESSPDAYFLTVIAVPPVKFRPVSEMNGMTYENPQNIYLTEILKSDIAIKDSKLIQRTWNESHKEEDPALIAARNKEFLKRTIQAWVKLQESVNYFIDSSKAPSPGGKLPTPGIKQVLEKKEGLFRKHMMGKRVNYAARSVISPDPYIETNEIGVIFTYTRFLQCLQRN
jgi:DNA-directed RNA polymerase I subunit RPA1